MATLGGVDLGTVKSESHTKDGSLFNQPLPGSDSNEAILIDIFGVSRTINISGVKADTAANITIFIAAMEALIAGNQVEHTFVSSITSNKTVFVDNFD